MAAALFGGVALVASLLAAAPAVASGPSVPTSTVKPGTADSVRYCVAQYAPDVKVSVHAEGSGAAATIHTNNRGSGCTDLAVASCSGARGERIDAIGTGADGNPATSSATIGAADVPACVSTAAGGPGSAASAHGSTFTATDAALAGVGAALLLGLGVGGVLVVRRRRATSTAAPTP